MSGKSKPTRPKGDGGHTPTTPKVETDFGDDFDPCDIIIDIDLAGVRPQGLTGLSVGDTLDVILDQQGGLRSAVCRRRDGTAVGSIANLLQLTSLLNCLERGVRYQVVVTEILAGGCHVRGGRVA